MALVFPPGPTPGQRYPVNPGTSGVTQYEWNNIKGVWNAVLSAVSLGSPNQAAYNGYQWPAADGLAGRQLTTDGAGNLTWSGEADVSIQAVGITPLIDGVSFTYTLVEYGTGTFFTPVPSTNLVVFLGGVPQVPTVNYNVVGNQITFTDLPPNGTTFYAISNITV
jgi:hypothetical protein